MKRSLLIIVAVVLTASFASAQYRVNKHQYSHKGYTFQEGDKYSPTLSAVLSVVVPGAGQMASGEFGRGLLFTGSVIGSATVFVVGFGLAWGEDTPAAGWMMVGGLLGTVGFWTWSIIDAPKVAKVNNLALRDKRGSAMSLKLSPYVGYAATANGGSVAPGLGLRVAF